MIKSFEMDHTQLFAPKIRLADIYEKLEDFDHAISSLEDALAEVQTYSSDWTDDKKYFDGYIEDRLSLFYYYQKHNYLKAIEYSSRALQCNPNNSRVVSNLKFYYNDFIKSRGE
jgi:tetratricopeptide (TPR) repeat protein